VSYGLAPLKLGRDLCGPVGLVREHLIPEEDCEGLELSDVWHGVCSLNAAIACGPAVGGEKL